MKKHRILSICALALILTLAAAFAPRAAATDAPAPERPEAFTAAERGFIADAPVLKVGYVDDRRPISFTGADGELDGVSRRVFDRISQISGLRFEYVELPGGSVTYDYLLQEGFDFVTSVEYNQENQQARGILMSDPYLTSRKVIVARDDLPYDPGAQVLVAISSGSQTIKKALSELYPNFDYLDCDSIESCFEAVRGGEADLLIQNRYVAEYWLYKPIYAGLEVIPLVELTDQLCFSAVTPLEFDETDPVWLEKQMYINIINKSIAQFADGEVTGFIISEVMENKYEYTLSDFLYQYRVAVIAIAVALALILLLLYANFRIRLRSARDRADAEAKGAFLSTMSHEIRTPLNGLISLNQLMKQHLDDRARTAEYLRQSSAVSKYLLSLVNNILDMSKLESSELTLEQAPVDLPLLFSMVDAMERSSLEKNGITFTVDADLPHPAVLGDEVRIQQVLLNLIDNARKFTPSGGSVTVTVRQQATGGGAVRTQAVVADTGRGMSEAFQKKIFDPFTQERQTVSQGNQGTGLGMAICARIAERMGGSLSVESKLGEGSRFTFVFLNKPAPADALADAPTSPDAPKPAPADAPARTAQTPRRILIAEDNELNGAVLAELLTDAGYDTDHVLDGEQAVACFESSAPGAYAAILMDLMMPKLDGLGAARAIRALDRPDAKRIPIIACTANSFRQDMEQALEAGMDDFVPKPIDIDLLLQKLETHLTAPV